MGTTGSKPKNPTTTPSTPTTASGQPAFGQAEATAYSSAGTAGHHEAIPEVHADVQPHSQSSRFQVSPISEERPGNLAIDQRGMKKICQKCYFSRYPLWDNFEDFKAFFTGPFFWSIGIHFGLFWSIYVLYSPI